MNIIKVNIVPPKDPTELFLFETVNEEGRAISIEEVRELIRYMPAGNNWTQFIGHRILSVGYISIKNEVFHFIMFSVVSGETDVFGRYGLVYASAILSRDKSLVKSYLTSRSEMINLDFPCLQFSEDHSPVEYGERKKRVRTKKVVYYKEAGFDKSTCESLIIDRFMKKENFKASSLTLFRIKEYDFQAIYNKEERSSDIYLGRKLIRILSILFLLPYRAWQFIKP